MNQQETAERMAIAVQDLDSLYLRISALQRRIRADEQTNTNRANWAGDECENLLDKIIDAKSIASRILASSKA